MKTKIAGLAIAIAAMAPAYAGSNDIQELAEYTGLSERKVQMILGCRSCYAEYRYTYQRSLNKFKQALGEENVVKMPPMMASEDFGNFSLDQKIPATIFWLGASDPAKVSAPEAGSLSGRAAARSYAAVSLRCCTVATLTHSGSTPNT